MERAIQTIIKHETKCDCFSCKCFRDCCFAVTVDWSDDLVRWATYHLYGTANGDRAFVEAELRGFDAVALRDTGQERKEVIKLVKVDFVNRRRIA